MWSDTGPCLTIVVLEEWGGKGELGVEVAAREGRRMKEVDNGSMRLTRSARTMRWPARVTTCGEGGAIETVAGAAFYQRTEAKIQENRL